MFYDIVYLADYPQFVDACAAWDHAQWNVLKSGSSFDQSKANFANSSHKNQIPLTLIALHVERQIPIAMASLWESDGPYWLEYSPWIASVFVQPFFQGKGIGVAMVYAIEKEAKKLGFDKVYLHANTAAALYPKLGYTDLNQQKPSNIDSSITNHLFAKTL